MVTLDINGIAVDASDANTLVASQISDSYPENAKRIVDFGKCAARAILALKAESVTRTQKVCAARAILALKAESVTRTQEGTKLVNSGTTTTRLTAYFTKGAWLGAVQIEAANNFSAKFVNRHTALHLSPLP